MAREETMAKEEAIARVKHQRDWANEVNRMLDAEAFEMAAKAIEDVEALNAINLDLASENEDLVERIGKLIGYIDFLRNTAQGKKKSLNLLEKVVKGELEEIRAEGENFVKPRTGEWIPVTERLPEEGYSVLVMRITDENYKYMRVATYQGDCWMDDTDIFNKPNPHKVIAWMPLPKPYKAKSEGARNDI